MKADLERYIGQARWFGGKGREHAVTDVRRAGTLSAAAPADHPQPCVGIELVTVEYTGSGDHEVYQVPLAYYGEEQERLEHAYVGSWEDPDLGEVHAYDALHDRAAAGGAEIVMGLTDQDYGSREFAARDPHGNVWCFGTYRPGQG